MVAVWHFTYVKSSFSVLGLTSVSTVSIPKYFEFIFWKIDLGHNNSVIVTGAYRPPSAALETLEKFGELIAPLLDHEMIILGDLIIRNTKQRKTDSHGYMVNYWHSQNPISWTSFIILLVFLTLF